MHVRYGDVISYNMVSAYIAIIHLMIFQIHVARLAIHLLQKNNSIFLLQLSE